MSDILIFTGSMVVTWNFLIALIMSARGLLEKEMTMRQLSALLKTAVIYNFLFIPVITAIILYKSTFLGKISVDGDDFTYLYVIGRQTFGTSAPALRNHWLLYILFCIWILGIAYKGVLRFFNDSKLLDVLKKSSTGCLESSILEQRDTISKQLNIKKTINILKNEAIISPFTAGIFQQTIFIPADTYTQDEWRLILKHELIHCKYNDYFFRRLIFILCSFYWFNPYMEKFAEYYVEINEIACDDTVLENEVMKIRSFYGHLLITFQKKELSGLNAVSLTGHTENTLERRIRNIMKKGTKKKTAIWGALSIAVILSCPFSTFAAANGVSYVQDFAVKRTIQSQVDLSSPEQQIEKIEFLQSAQDITKLNIPMNPRGISFIDITIDGNSLVETEQLSLEANAEVDFLLAADNNTDSFKAGLIDSNGKKTYVQSSKGKLSHTFKVKQDGEYAIFVEGTSAAKIHVKGSINVSN